MLKNPQHIHILPSFPSDKIFSSSQTSRTSIVLQTFHKNKSKQQSSAHHHTPDFVGHTVDTQIAQKDNTKQKLYERLKTCRQNRLNKNEKCNRKEKENLKTTVSNTKSRKRSQKQCNYVSTQTNLKSIKTKYKPSWSNKLRDKNNKENIKELEKFDIKDVNLSGMIIKNKSFQANPTKLKPKTPLTKKQSNLTVNMSLQDTVTLLKRKQLLEKSLREVNTSLLIRNQLKRK